MEPIVLLYLLNVVLAKPARAAGINYFPSIRTATGIRLSAFNEPSMNSTCHNAKQMQRILRTIGAA
jgi:hypothetical protein